VEVRKAGFGELQRTESAHHTCPANFGVGVISHEAELPTGLTHEDIGRIYRLGYATFEWIGNVWMKYREDGLPCA
jgi:hypothetical protein